MAEKVSEDEIYEDAMENLEERIGDLSVTPATIMTILRYAMEVVEITQLKGRKQNELCTKLIKELVIKAPISGSNERLLLDMVNSGILTDTIDLVVDATHGDIDVNSAIDVAMDCCAAFLKRRA